MDANTSAPSTTEIPAPEVPVLSSKQQSESLIKDHVLWSVGCGIIPVPLVDLAGVTATQIHLISKMSAIYGVPFSEHRVKNIITPLIASVGVVPVAAGLLSSVVKVVPVLGTVLGVASMPVVAGATTYALGKVFISHFEAGGTLLDFKPEAMKAYYGQMFQEGKLVAEALKKDVAPAEAAKSAKAK